MARTVADAGARYYREAMLMGDTHWEEWLGRTAKDRQDVSDVVGVQPEQLSFLQNASLALNIIALTVGPGSRVLALDKEFPSCTTPFIRAGCELRFVQSDDTGFFDAKMLGGYLKLKPRVFVISSVQFANGFRANLGELGRLCRDNGILFVVDATQSIGAFPVNMIDDFIDALVFSGFKTATAGYGVAVLATTDTWPDIDPPLVGWRSSKNAWALENDRLDMHRSGVGHEMGHPAFPGIFSLGEAMRLLSQTGIDAISSRIIGLATQLREGLENLDIAIRSHTEPEHFSGIVLADVERSDELCCALRSQGVWTSSRDGGLRISLHGYNSEADIDRFLSVLDSIRKV